jgi:hypothetical protein
LTWSNALVWIVGSVTLRGFSPEASSQGAQSIRHRVRLVGGQIQLI